MQLHLLSFIGILLPICIMERAFTVAQRQQRQSVIKLTKILSAQVWMYIIERNLLIAVGNKKLEPI